MSGGVRAVRGCAVVCAALIAGFLAGAHRERIASVFEVKEEKVIFAGTKGALVGKIYHPRGLGRRRHPGILFCHGMLPKGKGAKVYSHLMRELARRGYLVMGFDIRGFGESSKAAYFNIPRDLDFFADVDAALCYMLRQLPVENDTVTIAGHSMGGNLAFAVGARESAVRNIVAISAGDFAPPGHYPLGLKQHFVRLLGHTLHHAITEEDWDRLEQPLVMGQYLPLPARKSVLLILVAGEAPGTAHYNRRLFAKLAVQKDMVIIPDSNHTLGFTELAGNEAVDPRPVKLVAAAIDEWLRKTAQPER